MGYDEGHLHLRLTSPDGNRAGQGQNEHAQAMVGYEEAAPNHVVPEETR
jgi:hypothetical protein